MYVKGHQQLGALFGYAVRQFLVGLGAVQRRLPGVLLERSAVLARLDVR